MNQNANTVTIITASSYLLLLTLITTACTPANSPKPIRLTSGNHLPEIIPPRQATPTTLFDGRYFKLIQFNTIPDAAQRTAWASTGLHLVDYLPDDTYFAVIDQNFDLNQLTNAASTIIDVDARFKVTPALTDTSREKPSQLVASYYNTLDANSIIADLQARGVVVANHRPHARQLDIISDPAQFDALVALPYLQFIDIAPTPGVLEEPPPQNSNNSP